MSELEDLLVHQKQSTSGQRNSLNVEEDILVAEKMSTWRDVEFWRHTVAAPPAEANTEEQTQEYIREHTEEHTSDRSSNKTNNRSRTKQIDAYDWKGRLGNHPNSFKYPTIWAAIVDLFPHKRPFELNELTLEEVLAVTTLQATGAQQKMATALPCGSKDALSSPTPILAYLQEQFPTFTVERLARLVAAEVEHINAKAQRLRESSQVAVADYDGASST